MCNGQDILCLSKGRACNSLLRSTILFSDHSVFGSSAMEFNVAIDDELDQFYSTNYDLNKNES